MPNFVKQLLEKERIGKELISSGEYLMQLTAIIKRDGIVDNDPDSSYSSEERKYISYLSLFDKMVSMYCDSHHISEITYKDGSKGYAFSYCQPKSGKKEYYFMSFIPGQGGVTFCFQIEEEEYQAEAFAIEKMIREQIG